MQPFFIQYKVKVRKEVGSDCFCVDSIYSFWIMIQITRYETH